MDPFRNYRKVFPARAQHCPFGGCLVCWSQPFLVGRDFDDLVRRTWDPAERDMLGKAARAALL